MLRSFLDDTQVAGNIIAGPFGFAEAPERRPTVYTSAYDTNASLDPTGRWMKRGSDLVIATTALIALAPLLAAIAIAIAIDSPGPVLFRQARVGRGNRNFGILKFRTMRHDACDPLGIDATRRDDDRITRVGRFLRRSSLDELPQLVNVVLGQMSLVGPRPHCLESRVGETLFWQVSEHYWRRHSVRPGLTGLAQVRGNRGSIGTIDELEERLRWDLEYIRDWRFFGDLAILFRTVRVMMHPKAF